MITATTALTTPATIPTISPGFKLFLPELLLGVDTGEGDEGEGEVFGEGEGDGDRESEGDGDGEGGAVGGV